MIFDEPVQFDEAVRALRVKRVLPTTLSSAELQALDSAIKRKAFMAARVTNAGFLQRAKDLIDDILSPSRASGTTRGELPASVRAKLRQFILETGYSPDKPGSIEDLSSDARLNLIIETQAKMAFGLGDFIKGQTPAILLVWPAQELYRAEPRREPRDWPLRWRQAGGRLRKGRMVALKDDSIWQQLGDGAGGYSDTLGNPFPPFAFNSGMSVRDIMRSEAVELGVMKQSHEAKPHPLLLEDWIEQEAGDLSADIKGSLLSSLGAGYEIVKGVLKLVGNEDRAMTTYRRGAVEFGIENPKGSVRSGVDRHGNEWSVRMPADYGFVRHVSGADGDSLDAFIGDQPAGGDVFVLATVDPETQLFDEHKCMVGFKDEHDALLAFARAYHDAGEKRVSDVRRVHWADFENFLERYDRQMQKAA